MGVGLSGATWVQCLLVLVLEVAVGSDVEDKAFDQQDAFHQGRCMGKALLFPQTALFCKEGDGWGRMRGSVS